MLSSIIGKANLNITIGYCISYRRRRLDKRLFLHRMFNQNRCRTDGKTASIAASVYRKSVAVSTVNSTFSPDFANITSHTKVIAALTNSKCLYSLLISIPILYSISYLYFLTLLYFFCGLSQCALSFWQFPATFREDTIFLKFLSEETLFYPSFPSFLKFK